MLHGRKKNIKSILTSLDRQIKSEEKELMISFTDFLCKVGENPYLMLRNIFQIFSDMIYHYTHEKDEYEDDPENIKYKTISCDKLLVEGTDTPFFADLPLANRIVRLADSFKEGAQQNKIYLFVGPPGSGKSTLLNNLLGKFEKYIQSAQGVYFEAVWKIDGKKLGNTFHKQVKDALVDYYNIENVDPSDVLEVPCPSHDHPILMIPKSHRRQVLEQVLPEDSKAKIFHKKEYEWIFQKNPCTICESIYESLNHRLKSSSDLFDMLFVKRFLFNRRLAYGISVYNPGDRSPEKLIRTNEAIQRELGYRLKDSNAVQYIFSKYAKTNNGVHVIMDVKGYNEKRFMNLHGIISEGTHKIEDIEENINSLFLTVMNPQDTKKIEEYESFKDRIREINVNYILNSEEEVKIYCNAFGDQIRQRFLPGVIDNFAKIIISSRLNCDSETIKEWIKDPQKYNKYCDENLLLLKLSIYNNKIPTWLSDEDRNTFDKNMRRKLIGESDQEGKSGISGRESLIIFNEFYNAQRKKFQDDEKSKKYILITMDHIKEYFEKHKEYTDKVPDGFIDSIIRLHDYDIMQQIKEALFHQNEERISKDIQNYLFALNYDNGEKLISPYTKEAIEVNDNFFNSIEQYLFTNDFNEENRIKLRSEIASKFTISIQDMQLNGMQIIKTNIYKDLYNSYIKNLRENIFQPFLKYTSFESAIKDYGTEKFEVYDNRTKEQVEFLILNLKSKFDYSLEGARQVCLYAIHKKINNPDN
jgi:predicted Ser/Thr protein kinase